MSMQRPPLEDRIYHVHTTRCGHATEETDEEYIEAAIALGAKELSFSEHMPVPGDPFNYQMPMSRLPEYVATLKRLKAEYADRITIRVGMECEYLPSLDGYIRSLLTDYGMEFLILGQHLYEHADGTTNFRDDEETRERFDVTGLAEGMIAGIKTGLFETVAHPDRIFRRRRSWGEEEAAIAKRIIEAAMAQKIPLEINMESRNYPEYHFYWPEFWKLVPPECEIVYGVDAHAVKEMVDNTIMIRKILNGEIE
ncbi:MAG: histidinol-phosphatase [Lachnospiraceae bacterium]|nr:histidinol-phosphatase [Lachnospiraceae bacterium]